MSAEQKYDVVIIGGSFAGIQTAMALARQMVPVLVVDSGKPRNRFASEAHNVLGHDGSNPLAVLKQAREQLMKYPAVKFHQGTATKVELAANYSPEHPSFVVTLDNGPVSARRVMLACGVTDTLPNIENIWDFWGEGVAHCPHCHGYEVRGKRLGVVKTGPFPMFMMPVGIVCGLSRDVTVFTNGEELKDEEKKILASKGCKLVEGAIKSVEGDKASRALHAIHLTDGTKVALDCAFVAPKTAPNGPFVSDLSLETEMGIVGPHIKTDPVKKETSVAGVFAAGDLAKPYHQVSFAAADGTQAGVFLHASLMIEPTVAK